MSNRPAQVAGNAAPAGVGPQPTPGGAGVANPPGNVTPGQPPADARANVDWEAKARKLEQDINNLKSVFQSQASQQQQQFDARYANLQQQLQQQYLAHWTQTVKVPIDQLDISSVEALNASGWAYVSARLEGTLPPTAGSQPPVTPAAPGQPLVVPAPEVVVDQTQAPGGGRTWPSLRESLGVEDDEAIYRALETGQ